MSLRSLLENHPSRDTIHLDELVAAIEAASACADNCSACADACIPEGGEMADCIRTCRDCEDVCRATAAILSRPAPAVKAWTKLVEACIAICDECADECGSHDNGHCRECAKACRACADACRALLKAAEAS